MKKILKKLSLIISIIVIGFVAIFLLIDKPWVPKVQAATDQTIGDQNNDGVINLVDARILAPPATTSCPVCVDVNGDKKIDDVDIKLVKYNAGLYAPSFETPSYRFHPRFDINNDKTLDENDVNIIQNYLDQKVEVPAFGLDDPSELGYGFKANEILITYRDSPTESEKQALFSKYNLTFKYNLETLQTGKLV